MDSGAGRTDGIKPGSWQAEAWTHFKALGQVITEELNRGMPEGLKLVWPVEKDAVGRAEAARPTLEEARAAVAYFVDELARGFRNHDREIWGSTVRPEHPIRLDHLRVLVEATKVG